jgi:hypothetical protein
MIMTQLDEIGQAPGELRVAKKTDSTGEKSRQSILARDYWSGSGDGPALPVWE